MINSCLCCVDAYNKDLNSMFVCYQKDLRSEINFTLFVLSVLVIGW